MCVLVGELDRDGKLNIVGVGTCPSQGLRRGVVVNIEETVTSIGAALDRAERLSGKKITTAYVGIAGGHISSENSKGFVAISPSHRDIIQNDISGGTTDIAVFADGAIWQTVVLPIGGNHITSDIAIGLHLPFGVAEELKVTYGHCDPSTIASDDMIDLSHFMPGTNDLVPRKLLAEIIQARVEELFEMVHEEIKKSGYDGLLPAGLILTGGGAELPGILDAAGQILDLPARLGSPLGLLGLADSISRPAYATSVGLLLWGLRHTLFLTDEDEMEEIGTGDVISRLGRWFRAFVP